MDDFVVVTCKNFKCGACDSKQRVPNGISITPTVRLVATWRCALCGHDLEVQPA